MKTILGIDPGRYNAAFCVVQMKPSDTTSSVVHRPISNGMLKYSDIGLAKRPLDAIKDFQQEFSRFLLETNPDIVVVERYVARRFSAGPTIEIANVMIGIMGTHIANYHPQIEFILVTPAMWKNAVNREFHLKSFYAFCKVTPHEIDACLLALFGGFSFYKVDSYSTLRSRGKLLRLMTQLENSSRLKLRNIRKKRADYDRMPSD